MTPIPTTPMPLPPSAGTNLAAPAPAGREASAAGSPAMARMAVTQAKHTLRTDSQKPKDRTPLEPPADPPPVKGLGIPALHTAVVGDFDEIDTRVAPQPQGFSQMRDALNARAPSVLDLRR